MIERNTWVKGVRPTGLPSRPLLTGGGEEEAGLWERNAQKLCGYPQASVRLWWRLRWGGVVVLQEWMGHRYQHPLRSTTPNGLGEAPYGRWPCTAGLSPWVFVVTWVYGFLCLMRLQGAVGPLPPSLCATIFAQGTRGWVGTTRTTIHPLVLMASHPD